MHWRRVFAAAALLAPALTTHAHAHSGDPNVFTRIDAITPELPGVTVEIRAGVADQLLVLNTTPTPVEVLDPTGTPFLRITDENVEANYSSADWYLSNSPLGRAQAPKTTKHDDWRVVARTGSWGWFDHRLHDRARPLTPQLKAATTTVRLAEWTIPLRYGGRAVTVAGHVEYRPVLGAFRTNAEHTPRNVTADVLDGRVPGLFVTWQGSSTLVVTGTGGEPFARFTPRGVEVNEASETWHEDQRLRGTAVTTVTENAATPRWRMQAATPQLTWLDRRLAYAPGVPPDQALRAREDTTVVEWAVPVTVDGTNDAITGTTTWHPATTGDPKTSRLPYAVAGATVLLLGTLLGVRKRVARR